MAGYVLFGYVLHRNEFAWIASVYIVLFAAYLYLVRRSNEVSFQFLIAAAVLFRFVFLLSIPRMSDDYFRFVWDGMLSVQGMNPYADLPVEIMQSKSGDSYLVLLYEGMNSKQYYSVYPPILQSIFAAALWHSPANLHGAVIILRLSILAAEIGTLILLKKLLERFHLPKTNLLWYAFNPLVIIELSGNLHFEAVMIFFLLLAIWWLLPSLTGTERRSNLHLLLSSVAYGFSIATKLIPLMFLPFLIRRLGWQRVLIYFSMIAAILLLLFLPFLNMELIRHIGSSIDLYFQKFEFNASIYYLIRWIGFGVNGYNIIQSAGPWLALSVFLLVLLLMISEKKLTASSFFSMAQWSLAIFLLLSTTVHPWYLASLVMMSVVTEKRFAIVWSLVVVLSYAAYQNSDYHENLWLIAAEYLILLPVLVLDFRREIQVRHN